MIEDWQAVSLRDPPYFFPADEDILRAGKVPCASYRTYRSFAASSHLREDARDVLFVSLIPKPYIGELATADIILLQLNPGFGAHDVFGELQSSEFRRALVRNLRQEHGGRTHRFPFRDPRFAWHGGFTYWESRLRPYVAALQQHRALSSYQDALAAMGRRLAVLELVPYHSRRWCIPGSTVRRLPSAQLAVAYAHDVLVPRARTGAAMLIVVRGHKFWRMPRGCNIFAERHSFNRGGFFIRNAAADRALRDRIELP